MADAERHLVRGSLEITTEAREGVETPAKEGGRDRWPRSGIEELTLGLTPAGSVAHEVEGPLVFGEEGEDFLQTMSNRGLVPELGRPHGHGQIDPPVPAVVVSVSLPRSRTEAIGRIRRHPDIEEIGERSREVVVEMPV
jgi:hypothetical protein